MPDDKKPGPDITAMRTALWRAMHVQLDSPPHVFKDEIGLKLALPEEHFEGGASWWERLMNAGFDSNHPAVVVSTGVSMYLTKAATKATLRQLATLAPGSTVAMTFLTPVELRDPEDRSRLQWAKKSVAASGTPAVSFFDPAELLALSREVGFNDARHVSAADHDKRYFSGRTDGLRPSSGEDFLVATT